MKKIQKRINDLEKRVKEMERILRGAGWLKPEPRKQVKKPSRVFITGW